MNNINIPDIYYTFVIFGGTGDLTHRKLIPALYNLEHENILPDKIKIVAIGRRDYDQDDYLTEINQSVKKHIRFKYNENVWESLKNKIKYLKVDFTKKESYCDLNESLNNLEDDSIQTQRIYYLAVAPEYFEDIVDNLKQHCMSKNTIYKPRVVIEKPFGRDLESATYLNNKIVGAFSEENTYRIDHYLGKEMLQNIMVIRFANLIFEPVWNNKYIEQVQILSSETLGVGTRGDYYEKSGATRDMLQSHLLQLVSLIAMERPKNLDTQAIRDEKVKVLKSLKQYTIEEINDNVVRGQYGPSDTEKGYRDELKVDQKSTTETYVALKTFVENERWKGVPFYIRTGKRLPTKTTVAIIQFKAIANKLYNQIDNKPNLLVIKIQPEEGVYFQFNAKKPGSGQKIVPVKMDFCQNCQIGINSPEAYERLLFDVMRGDATLFARWDEVEYSWKFVDIIMQAWKHQKPDFPNYIAGSWGPKEADIMIAKDNKHWFNTENEDDYENI